jgi:putative ABC transport system permease protein
MRFLRRLRHLIGRRDFDAELSEELDLHRELRQRDYERRGLSAADAALAARRQLGSLAQAQDEARDVWNLGWLRDFSQDVRFGCRVLAKDRRFTLAVILTLGLGIGVNNSVFTIVNTALIRAVPFSQPDRLVGLELIDRDGRRVGLSFPDYRDWTAAKSLEGIGVTVDAIMNLSESGRPPERLRGSFVSPNLFPLLRSTPVLGRSFLEADDRPGAPLVVILGYSVWQDRYGGDPSVLGRSVRIDDAPATIIGVMPKRFTYPFIAQAWQPLAQSPRLPVGQRDARPLRNVVARLTPTADLASARAELETIAAGLEQSFPATNKDLRPLVRPMSDAVAAPQVKPILMTFMGAAVFVLLIACANIASLLLARATARSREIAIRASLGATRWRIVRQLLVECLVLAALGGAIGIAFSVYGAGTLAVAFSPLEAGARPGDILPYWVDLSIDKIILTFVGAACLFATLACGLVPALQAARVRVNDALKEAGRGGADSRRTRWWGSLFVVAQLALSIVLLVGAGLLWRSFYALYRTDLGIQTAGITTTRLALPATKYDTAEKRHQFFDRLQQQLADVVGTGAVAVTSQPPLTPGGAPRELEIEGASTPPDQKPPAVSYVYAGTGYFEMLGVRRLAGRFFTETDGLPGREVAVVDDRFAARFFAGADPVGRRIRLGRQNTPGKQPWLTIVGVTRSLADFSPPSLRQPIVYVPLRGEPAPGPDISIVARGTGETGSVISALREQVRILDPGLPLYGVETLDATAERSRTPQRLVGTWFGVIAFVALTLSTMGVYALTSYGVARRKREIGVRVALGAQTHQVTWLFLRATTAHLSIGLAVGIFGALTTGRLLQTFLVGTSARDPVTLVSVAGLLTAIALLACLLPARRAARIDPMIALRGE